MAAMVSPVPPIAGQDMEECIIVPSPKTAIMKKEPIKGWRNSLYTKTHTKQEAPAEMGEMKALKPR